MAIFGKKQCEVCGAKMNAMGAYAIRDGFLCMDCKNSCSKQLRGLRRLSSDEIREHLSYRAENAKRLRSFRPDITIGAGPMLAANTKEEVFCYSLSDTVFNEQADLFRYDQAVGVEIDEVSHDNMPETRVFSVVMNAPETGIERIRVPETGCSAQAFAAMWDFFQAIVRRAYEEKK